MNYTDELDDEETTGRRRRRRERLVARLAPLAAEVHGLADAAAASAGGGVEVAARAFALVETVTLEHSLYLAEVELASPSRIPPVNPGSSTSW